MVLKRNAYVLYPASQTLYHVTTNRNLNIATWPTSRFRLMWAVRMLICLHRDYRENSFYLWLPGVNATLLLPTLFPWGIQTQGNMMTTIPLALKHHNPVLCPLLPFRSRQSSQCDVTGCWKVADNLICLTVMHTGTLGTYKAGQQVFNKSLKTSIITRHDYSFPKQKRRENAYCSVE